MGLPARQWCLSRMLAGAQLPVGLNVRRDACRRVGAPQRTAENESAEPSAVARSPILSGLGASITLDFRMVGVFESSRGKAPLSVTRTVTIGRPAPLEPSGVEGPLAVVLAPGRTAISVWQSGSLPGERGRRAIGTRLADPFLPGAPSPTVPSRFRLTASLVPKGRRAALSLGISGDGSLASRARTSLDYQDPSVTVVHIDMVSRWYLLAVRGAQASAPGGLLRGMTCS